MKYGSPLRPEPPKPTLFTAVILGIGTAAWLALACFTRRLLFYALFAVFFTGCIWTVRELLYRRRDRQARPLWQYTEREYQALGITPPPKDAHGRVRRVVSVLLTVATSAAMLYLYASDDAERVGPVLGAALPLMMILLGSNAARLTWREIRRQGFRLTVYALSLVLFAYHLLTFLGVISLQAAISANLWPHVELMLGVAFFPLLLAAMVLAVRDTWRRMQEQPL